MQNIWLMFALLKWLAFTPLFNAPKKHVLNNFTLEIATIIVVRRRHCREQRARGRRERICQKNTSEHIPNIQLGVTQYQLYQYFLQTLIFGLNYRPGRLSAPILSIFTIIDIGHFENRFANNFFLFFMQTNILFTGDIIYWWINNTGETI